MDLPKNDYTRYCARKAGALLHRFNSANFQHYDESSWFWHCRALRWQQAWWCSVAVGAAVDAGRLTGRAFLMAFLGSVFVSGLFGGALAGIGFGIYAIMYLGTVVLP